LFRKDPEAPLLFAPETTRGNQLVNVFKEHWQQLPPAINDLDAGFYRSTDEMKETVQVKLGIADSERRINAVKIAAGKIIVDADPRSRADIDAIYLTGNLEQTRLLKPFIDVNTSAFAQRIPVYASSSSHLRQASVSENDLHQVIFSEMPWLLPNHPDREALDALLTQRDGWNLSQARLAAMGHDSVQVLPFLDILNQLPGYRHAGYVGRLNSVNQRIQRELSWAQFQQHQVRPMTNDGYVPTTTWSKL